MFSHAGRRLHVLPRLAPGAISRAQKWLHAYRPCSNWFIALVSATLIGCVLTYPRSVMVLLA